MERLHYFNPTAELAISNGCASYQPPVNLQVFEADLACLPMVYSSSGDSIVVTVETPEFLIDIWRLAGLTIPEFLPYEKLANLTSVRPHRLQPWANSPNLRRIFPHYNAHEKKGIPQLFVPEWDSTMTELSSRSASMGIWDLLVSEGLACREDVPIFCSSMGQVEQAVSQIGRAVVKLSHTSSGRGIYFADGHIAEADKARIRKQITGGCIVDRWYDKIADFSMHFVPEKQAAKYIGWSEMYNSSKGKYIGNVIRHSNRLKVGGNEFCMDELLRPLQDFYERHLPQSIFMHHHDGPIGIDMLLYRDDSGAMKIHPCVEINARHTMGYVSLSLKKLLHQEALGTFAVHHFPEGAERECKRMHAESPLYISEGRIRHGFVPLTDYTRGAKFVATLTVK